MKHSFYFIAGLVLTITSCNSSTNGETPIVENDSTIVVSSSDLEKTTENENQSTQSDIIPTSKADYQEFYASGQLKIEGNFDENEARHGLWVSYYENGLKWSESYYAHGLKSGHSVTFFPNGKIRYVGEYKQDEKVGHWTFYDEEGNIVQEEEY